MAITLDIPGQNQTVTGDGMSPALATALTVPGLPAVGKSPLEAIAEADAKVMADYRAKALKQIDEAALDPDTFYKGQDMSFGRNVKEAQMLVTNDAFLKFYNNGDDLPEGDMSRRLAMKHAAEDLFDGQGWDSEEALYAQIVKSATARKTTRELFDGITNTSAASVTSGAVGEQATTFQAWREEAKKKPGYDPTKDWQYLDAWTQTQREAKEAIEPFKDELASVWKAMKAGGAGTASEVMKEMLPFASVIGDDLVDELQKKDAGSVAFEAYDKLAPEDRPKFMDGIHALVKSFPKEEQPAVLANLSKSGGRMIDDLARGVTSRFSVKGLEQYLNEGVAESRGPFGASEADKAQAAQNATRIQADRLAQKNFADDIRKMERGEYAPVRHFSKASDDLLSWRNVEEGIYGVPGVLASVGTVMIPGVGPSAMFLAMEDFAYGDLRDNALRAGMDEAGASVFADEWKTAAAVPQTALEILQDLAPMGKIPAVNKVLGAVGDKIKNRLTRFAVKTAAIGAAETAVEEAQYQVPYLVQEVASAFAQDSGMPEAVWRNGKDGAFDGFWNRQATTFLSMLPLAAAGAAGGLSEEARARAFAEATPLQRRAFGITEENSARIDAAAARGQSSLNAAVDEALSNRMPESEQARAAVIELQDEIAAKEAEAAATQKSPDFPTFVRNADGWSVRDGATGEEVGTANSPAAALSIAANHSAAIDEKNEDQVAFLATMLEAGEQTAKTKGTTFEFSPGKKVTAAQEAALSPKDEARVMEQIQAREGQSGMAELVLGKSVTEFKQRARNTANKINAGGSVLTVFHEEAHGFYREALNSGRLTKDETVTAVRALETALAGKKTKAGEDLRFLPDGEVTDTQLDEAVSELMEAEVIRNRKNRDKVPPGIISRNLSAMARLAPGATKKLSSFVNTVRDYFGLAFSRAYEIKKGIKEGKISEADIDAFTSKLFGLNEQDEFEQQTVEARDEILGGDPFSIGRSTISPTKDTHIFPGAEGEPSVIGPAAFSIGAFHGTPHLVDEFSTERIGSGEGAQVYGWGLYFASNRAVAEWYRRNLSKPMDRVVTVWDDPVYIRTNNGWMAESGNGHPLDYGSVEARALDAFAGIKPLDGTDSDAAAIMDDMVRIANPGNLYTVNLDFEETELLDWDALLEEQSSEVLEKLKASDFWEFAADQLEGGDSNPTGADLYKWMLDDMEPQEASETLAGLGIPGIKFLDGSSRGKGEGTRNYVAFQDVDVEITDHSFSLGPAKMADILQRDAMKRITDPKAKARIFQNVSDRMANVKALIANTGNAYNFDAFGKPYEGEARFSQEKKDILNGMAMMDGILAAMPPDLRGRVGGYTQLAKLDTPEKRLAYLRKKVKAVEKVVNNYLSKEYGKILDKLLERAKPVKGKPGEKPKGKAGAEIHAIFDVLLEAKDWDQAKVDQHIAGLEASILSGNLTPEQEAKATMEAALVGLVGNWKEADTSRRAAAVKAAQDAFDAGYARFKLATLMKAEDRRIRQANLEKDTGATGDAGERDSKIIADNGLQGGWRDNVLSLTSFEQVMQYAFGRDSKEAERIVDLERGAAHTKEDTTQADMDALEDVFTQLGGSPLEGERLRWEMAQKNVKIRNRTLSQMEMIDATLMWRQEDGKRHMLGHKDENGNYAGKWHYDQAFIDEIEAKLSDEAKVVRAFLSAEMAKEYDKINPTFKDLNGINMPKNADYWMLSVTPQQSSANQMANPASGGGAMSGASATPGSLRTRGTAIAEPEFKDAAQKYIAHKKEINHWLAYAPMLSEVGPILRNRELGFAVEEKGGKQAVSVMRGWLDYFTAGGVRDASAHLAMNQTVNRMMGRAASATLIGRASVLAVQSTQLAAALAEMPTGSFAMRFGKLLTGQLGWGAAMKSEYIQRRIKQMPVVVQQAMDGLKSSKPNVLKHNVAKLGLLIGGADGLFTAGTYAIIYDYQLKQAAGMGLSGADAQAYAAKAAERGVDRVAQPTRPGTRSLYENQSTNPAMRLMWSFASEARQKLMLAAWRMGSKDYTLGEQARAFAVTFIVGGMVANIIRAAVRDAKDDDDDETFDEKNWSPTKLVLSTATGPFQGIPYLGDMIEGGVYKLAGEYHPEGTLFSTVPSGLKAFSNMANWGDEAPDKIMKDVEVILSGAAVVDPTGNAAAAASLAHLARDLFGIVENAAGD